MQAFSPSAGKDSPVWGAIESLQKGISWHRTKPFLIFETRFFQATTLGFPVEISKYYESVNGITVNGEEANPAGNDRRTSISELYNTYETISIYLFFQPNLQQIHPWPIILDNFWLLKFQWRLMVLSGNYIFIESYHAAVLTIIIIIFSFFSFTKDLWIFYGINTDLFQCGAEMKMKWPAAIPWKFTAKINVPLKKFELDFPPLKKELELFSITYVTHLHVAFVYTLSAIQLMCQILPFPS